MDESPVKSWASFERTPAYYAWRGNAFEIACVNHVKEIKRALGVEAVETECFPWSSSAAEPSVQIDLVIERKDQVTNICEMKFTDGEFSIDAAYEKELRRKVQAFRSESKTRNAVQLAMVCARGMKANAHSWDAACVVTADDLFR